MSAPAPLSMMINTTGGTPPQGAGLSPQAAYWVAAFMVAGIVGLAAIGLIFRKHVEL